MQFGNGKGEQGRETKGHRKPEQEGAIPAPAGILTVRKSAHDRVRDGIDKPHDQHDQTDLEGINHGDIGIETGDEIQRELKHQVGRCIAQTVADLFPKRELAAPS